eukprot:CAMPEP_0119103672 /NCGR_PEP_ID=MMETSP1180-20130426/2065_1 /TAXON_ID=3052 ORGANISM="Chlamydomonas cf sp, Strain CCMP681" /NCGR_SAMPLE_ID=MMETSP1180 /ASSEMBLY_ACC=CAM_ASM_000741 /LENGTH=773 /DNA_ID=CAMNT_0007088237 /DNA_START=75 /DNA_END=2397 /DNA_ORIENTATION=-
MLSAKRAHQARTQRRNESGPAACPSGRLARPSALVVLKAVAESVSVKAPEARQALPDTDSKPVPPPPPIAPKVAAPPQAAQAPQPPPVLPQVVVLGAQGSSAIKLVKSLVEAGFKVTAGVDYLEEAQATLAFVRKYELIDRTSLANLKLSEPDGALPSRARVVIVEGDMMDGKKVDSRFVEGAIARAADSNASQIVLLTSGNIASGGLFGFGTTMTTNKSLSRTEQLLASSGLPFAVLRASISDTVEGEVVPTVRAGPGALSTSEAPLNGDALAKVLGALLAAPVAAPGVAIILESAAAPSGSPKQDVGAAVAAAVAVATSKAPAPSTRPAGAPKPSAAPAPSDSPANGLMSLGTISIRRMQEATGVGAAAPKPPAKKAEKAEEEDEEAGNFLTNLFGTKSISASEASGSMKKTAVKPSVKKVQEADEEEEEGNFLSNIFGTKSINVSDVKAPVNKILPSRAAPAPFKPAAKKVEEDSDEEEEDGNFLSNLFGTKAIQAPEARTPTKAPPPKLAPKPAPAAAKPAAFNPFTSAQARQAPPAAKKAEEPKQGTGFFSFLTPAAPEEDSSEDEEEPSKGFFGFLSPAPQAPKAAVKTMGSRQVAPPKPAPKPVAKPAPKFTPKPVAKPVARGRSPEPEPTRKSGGFFGFLGGKKDEDSDEEEEARPRTVRRAPPPPPPKAAPRPATVSFAAAKKPPPPPPKVAPKPAPKPAPKAGTQQVKPAATPAPGTYKLRGTYTPISNYQVEKKKKEAFDASAAAAKHGAEHLQEDLWALNV